MIRMATVERNSKIRSHVAETFYSPNFLFTYGTIPHATTGVSPCELFLNRSLRTRLDLLKPSLEETVSKIQAAQKRWLTTFKVVEKVMVNNYSSGPGTWSHSKVNGPFNLSYEVETKGGYLWRRHIHVHVHM